MNRRRLLWLALRITVSAALLAVAVRLIDTKRFLEVLGRVEGRWLSVLVPLLILPLVFLAWRWWYLLRANGFAVPYGRAFVLTYVGQFFNQFLPGALGGDVARMVLAARGEERKAAVATTVLLDRLFGLATMILAASVAVIPLVGLPKVRGPAIAVLGLLAAMGLFSFLYLSRRIRESRPGQWIRERLPFRKVVAEIDVVLSSVRRGPRMVAVAIGLSVAAQLSAVLVAYGLAQALHIRVALLPFVVFEVIIFILTAVAPSAGGWGVQEVAYAQLFATVNVAPDEAVALSVLVKLATLAVALPGGLLFATGAHRAGGPENADPAKADHGV
ncbi:MAG: flippase-like domain-containing protein [Planctomycetes bacterium]|nr:flippase-like domain-containing protein [Planctomycetota bacterium]